MHSNSVVCTCNWQLAGPSGSEQASPAPGVRQLAGQHAFWVRPASPPFASRLACLPNQGHSLNCGPPTDSGDSTASGSGDVDFIPGLDKCGTPEFDAAASKADLQAYFQSNGEAAAAACASAALDDFASICDCYVVLSNWMELSCPPCVKTEIERMVRHRAVQCGWGCRSVTVRHGLEGSFSACATPSEPGFRRRLQWRSGAPWLNCTSAAAAAYCGC